ncbi:hypothetical protein LCGC14_0375130 [marine sediment metagenome]|uniref:Uncharacterized protein n=1 Tax=marine sediment metagenome TaxID=412755 RepID=A0A0F9VR63_9ZZZZ
MSKPKPKEGQTIWVQTPMGWGRFVVGKITNGKRRLFPKDTNKIIHLNDNTVWEPLPVRPEAKKT